MRCGELKLSASISREFHIPYTLLYTSHIFSSRPWLHPCKPETYSCEPTWALCLQGAVCGMVHIPSTPTPPSCPVPRVLCGFCQMSACLGISHTYLRICRYIKYEGGKWEIQSLNDIFKNLKVAPWLFLLFCWLQPSHVATSLSRGAEKYSDRHAIVSVISFHET